MLTDWGEPMRAKDIHAAVQALAGEPVPSSSVKGALASNVSASSGRLVRGALRACREHGARASRYPNGVKHSVLSTTPTAEQPTLNREERAERLRSLSERLRSPDGLDRDTLARIEQLTDTER